MALMPDDTTAPVTAEDRAVEALRENWSALPDWDLRAAVRIVVAALAGDPGDLPARMAEAIRSHHTDDERVDSDGDPTYCVCGEMVEDWDDHWADAALSVRWERAVHLAARVGDAEHRAEHAESEHQVTQDRLDRARALVEGQQKTIREEITARGQVEAERDALNACIRATCSAARIAREVGDHRKVVLLSDVERLLTVPELPPLSPPDGDQ